MRLVMAFYPQLACHHDVLPQLTFSTFRNPYKLQKVSRTECVEMEVVLKDFAEDKRSKSNWPYPWSTQSSRSIFKYVPVLRIISSVINLYFCKSMIQVAALATHFPKTRTRSSTYFINNKLCRLISPIVLLTCSPISGRDLVWNFSCFGRYVMRNPLVSDGRSTWCLYMHSFCSVSPWFSNLDAKNTHLGLGRLQISAYVPCLHMTSLVSPKLLRLHLMYLLL